MLIPQLNFSFIFEWIHLAACYCPNQPNVGVGIPPSSTPVPRSAASCGMDHSSYPHAHSGLWLHVCAWGEDSQRAASLCSARQAVCALLLCSCSGCCWDVFWRKGCRAAGTHQYRRHWAWHEWQVKEAFEGGTRHRNVLQSAALRTGSLQRHFCTFLDLPTV